MDQTGFTFTSDFRSETEIQKSGFSGQLWPPHQSVSCWAYLGSGLGFRLVHSRVRGYIVDLVLSPCSDDVADGSAAVGQQQERQREEAPRAMSPG